MPDKKEIIEAIKRVAKELGHTPTLAEFREQTGIKKYWVTQHFDAWVEAVAAAGLKIERGTKLDDFDLLADWGSLVLEMRQIPTRDQYRRTGRYSVTAFDDHFGSWLKVPEAFRKRFAGDEFWSAVIALLPSPPPMIHRRRRPMKEICSNIESVSTTVASGKLYEKLDNLTVYGDHLDFRGMRHEPVNELGVVFFFGMLAKEIGYSVEAIQAAFPDCEAKRRISPTKWQRVRIEFEYESRSFREHEHDPQGCDIIVCWKHNWPDCPPNIEILELSDIINRLAKSDF